MTGYISGSRGGIFADDGNVYLNTAGYADYISNILDKKVSTDSSTQVMCVSTFEQTYGSDSTPCSYGMIIIHGYSRPNLWNGDTYYIATNFSGVLYNGTQVNGATSITWNKNLSTANFSLSGTTLTITT